MDAAQPRPRLIFLFDHGDRFVLTLVGGICEYDYLKARIELVLLGCAVDFMTAISLRDFEPFATGMQSMIANISGSTSLSMQAASLTVRVAERGKFQWHFKIGGYYGMVTSTPDGREPTTNWAIEATPVNDVSYLKSAPKALTKMTAAFYAE